MAEEELRVRDHEVAVQVLEALGIPKEMNVTHLNLQLNFSCFPAIVVQYTYLPNPIKLEEDGNLVSAFKKCKLVEIEKGGV